MKTCTICNKAYEEGSSDSYCLPELVCSSDCEAEHWKREHEKTAAKWWQTNVPRKFQNTNLSELPRPIQFAQAMAWDGRDGRGLILYGNSGLAKTRCLYWLLRDIIRNGVGVIFINAVEFQAECWERTKPGGSGDFKEWFDQMVNVEVLCIDDLDKTTFPPRVEAEIYRLIDIRTSNGNPILLSANSPSDEMVRNMSRKTGPAIIRRIKEFCEPINFNPVNPAGNKPKP